MTERTGRRLVWSLWTIGVVAVVGATVFHFAQGEQFDWVNLSSETAFTAVGVVGLVVARHQPRNALGWIYLSIWVGATFAFALVQEYAHWTETSRPTAPGGTVAVWLGNWLWVPIFTTLLTFPFLLFPDGHLPSRRWRPVAWTIVVFTALWSLAFAFEGSDFSDALGRPVANPFTPASLVPFFDAARVVLSFAVIILMGFTVAALVVRYRRAEGDEKLQIRWLMFAAGLTVGFIALPFNHGNGGPVDVVQGFVLSLIPLSIGVAMMKYRLYDIDVVISKTLVYGALAAFITLVYAAIVVAFGAAIGAANDSLPLSILATAIVAVAFQPVRERVQHLANRFVYGERATPYEILARFSERVAGTYATEDVLPRIARVLAECVGAERTGVWLGMGATFRLASSWPADAWPAAAEYPVTGNGLPTFDGVDRAVPVTYQEKLLGAITITKPLGDAITAAEQKLLDDLAGQAGLVLSNVRLTAQLEARLELIAAQAAELRASRQRIVVAQDEERRRLERNIHDGAQQHLVALAVKLRLAKGFLGKDPSRARAVLGELDDEVAEALDTLTSLSLGIYPPLLEEQGIAAALAAQYQRSGLPVRMTIDGTARYPIEAEAAVYFCVLEGLQNAAKHARATRIDVRIGARGGELGFEVEDDGRGFDPTTTPNGSGLQNLTDRLSVLGGSAAIESRPGGGTRVVGRVPIERERVG